MEYILKKPIDIYTVTGYVTITKIIFNEPLGKHLFANDISFDGLLEDYKAHLIIENEIKEVEESFNESRLDPTFNEVDKLEKIFKALSNRFSNEKMSKAVFYKKIDIAIRNIYFTQYDNTSLAEGFDKNNNQSILLKEEYYNIIKEIDLIGIREMFIKKNSSLE